MKRIPAMLFGASSLLLLLAAASCTDTLVGQPDTDDRTITFQTPQADTRAAVTGTSLTSGSFLVWGGYGGNATNVFDAVTVTGENNVWTYEGTRYWKAGETYDFYAVYPAELPADAEADVSSDGTITVTNFDCSATGDAAVDLMTAKTTGDGDRPASVKMPFHHELAKVAVVVQAAQGVTELTVGNVRLYGMDLQGTLNNQKGQSTWTDIEVGQRITYEKTPFVSTGGEVTPGTDLTLFNDLLLIPQLTDGVQISFELQRQGETSPTSVVGKLNSVGSWRAGSAFRYIITIESDAISFGGFTVENWETSSSEGNINIQ